MARSERVAVSILNWNGWEDTLECLESVRKLDYPNYLTVVVDNGSWNGSADKIKAWAEANLGPGHVIADYSRETSLAGGIPEIERDLDSADSPARMVLIRNEENLGFTGGNNTAVHYALQRRGGCDYVFLLNNDSVPDRDCLRQLVAAGRESRAGMVGAIVTDGDGKDILFGGRAPLLRQFFSPFVSWHLPPPEGHNGFWDSYLLPGTAMLIRSGVLRRVRQGSDEYLRDDFFMYNEAIVLSSRARKAGYNTVMAAHAKVRHANAASSGGRRNPLVYYYPTRNRIRAAKEVLPLRWRALFHVTNLTACAVQLVRMVARGQRHSSWAVLSGLIDGYRGAGGKWRYHDREVQRYASR